MAAPKKSATETFAETPLMPGSTPNMQQVAEAAPAPAYDPDDIKSCLKRLHAIAMEAQQVGSDLASHHTNCSTVRIHSHGATLNSGVYDVGVAARLHSVRLAISEFANAMRSHL